MMYLHLIGGIVIVLAAAEMFIRGAVSLAKILNIPPLVIGMIVVAIGTVHITCLPASSALSDIQAWSAIGLLI